ncbi:ferredoxin [Catenuloplanes atrovinosus]|uniref:Ferredoxin n=1 Tax=Catenuloplanes atrovinosus TaxID=137266 RepID=A0AAE4C8G0_9ACTN|nr:ferredoxin [Catenuloplanes atrovinosus]MDR7275486.1 ferredoxin [Catenuloplanes atrovinosus]
MKVTVDRDRCIGAGLCALTAPEVFDQEPEEAIVLLLDETPPETARHAVEQAVDRCPAGVIQLH